MTLKTCGHAIAVTSRSFTLVWMLLRAQPLRGCDAADVQRRQDITRAKTVQFMLGIQRIWREKALNEPKICPFCGDVGTLNADDQRKVVYCRCKNCGARGPIIAYNGREIEKEIAIESWNVRIEA